MVWSNFVCVTFRNFQFQKLPAMKASCCERPQQRCKSISVFIAGETETIKMGQMFNTIVTLRWYFLIVFLSNWFYVLNRTWINILKPNFKRKKESAQKMSVRITTNCSYMQLRVYHREKGTLLCALSGLSRLLCPQQWKVTFENGKKAWKTDWKIGSWGQRKLSTFQQVTKDKCGKVDSPVLARMIKKQLASFAVLSKLHTSKRVYSWWH